MNRYLSQAILQDLHKKMVVLTGPRQVGKTTLARQLPGFVHPIYLNYDAMTDRARIMQHDWSSAHDLVVLDEIHAMPNWKQYLKGVFDTKPKHQALLVTGSARLDTFRQSGESLAGRYLRWRLLPFSVRELCQQSGESADLALAALLRFGGFPEPLFAASDAEHARWQNQYFTDLIREDVLEYSRIHEVRAMRTLVAMLRLRTGSPLSFESLGRDLGLAANTVRSYVDILEALHIVFLIRPYHRNIARAQAKAPKLYFYDWSYVQEPSGSAETNQESGAQFENLVAVHLLKHLCFLQDSVGFNGELNYLRTTAGKEIDFVLTNEVGDATHFIEVKLSDSKPSLALKQMAASHPNAKTIQVVKNARHGFDQAGVQIRPAASWLFELAA
jgi:predicted AAA+ superfamily ATPase